MASAAGAVSQGGLLERQEFRSGQLQNRDADRCIFEIMSTKTYPAGADVPRARVDTVTELEDPAQVRLIPRQDLGNIPRMQEGLHSKGVSHTWLAVEQEKIILNMQRERDRYLRDEI